MTDINPDIEKLIAQRNYLTHKMRMDLLGLETTLTIKDVTPERS